MRQLVISCSLNPGSRSAVLAEQLAGDIRDLGDEVRLIDLRKMPLPMCDAAACYADASVQELQAAIQAASAVTLATPIYNYETGGCTRNVVALGGQSFKGKVMGFVVAAGGQGSYMAVMSLVNSLMLDFRCLVVPRFVFATGEAFKEGRLADAEIQQRLAELAAELHRVATAVGRAPAAE